ncbi:MAG TPA: TOBE domain-containing protein [Terriglobales bacterium]|nr:TOBE domain-containing protein [Terriglobales bacterium]
MSILIGRALGTLGVDPAHCWLYDLVPMRADGKSRRTAKTEHLLQLRDAALQLGVSFPTIKQWIYKKKLRSVQTAGGHHRIPQSEVDKLLFRTRGNTEKERQEAIRRVSGRNQLVGRIDSVRISGLMAEVKISIGGQQITSIITATSAREMQLKKGQTAAALIKATEVMIIRV